MIPGSVHLAAVRCYLGTAAPIEEAFAAGWLSTRYDDAFDFPPQKVGLWILSLTPQLGVKDRKWQ